MNMYASNQIRRVTILVIEDSAEIQEATSLIFELHCPDAIIVRAYKGGEGIDKVRSEYPNIVLLDLGLPDMDGLRVLKEIRDFSNVPVIILTVRGEEMDKVRGLEMGADDYVVKPFAHKELLARMKAVLDRRGNYAGGVKNEEDDTLYVQDHVKIDVETGLVTRNDKPVKLTSTERSLLKYLTDQRGNTISEREILAHIWGEEYSDCDEYLQVYVKRLREKLEANPARPRIIVKDADGYRISQSAI